MEAAIHLKLDELREVTRMARRIAAILLMEPALNECHAAVKADSWEWKPVAPTVSRD